MLQTLREKSKYILWIVVVGIVVWFGSQGFTALVRQIRGGQQAPERGVIARVDDSTIMYADFSRVYRQRLNEYAERTGAELTDATAEAIREETWNSMLADVLIENEINRLAINIPNEQVANMLWNNPPEYIYRSPAFQTEDGRFDFDAYHRSIQLNPEQWEQYAQMYRRSMRRQTLQEQVTAGALVTDNEVWTEFTARNERVRVTYAVLDPRALGRDTFTPTEDEARQYYKLHRAEYEQPATATLRYVRFAKEPTEYDREQARLRIEDIVETARAGGDFAELAMMHSEDPGSARNGGDVGWFDRSSNLVEEFKDVAFSLDAGEISDPFLTQFGYHTILVEETRGSGDAREVKARHILIQVRPTQETLTDIESRAVALRDAANEAPLVEAAEVSGYAVESTGPFADERFIPRVGNARPAVRLAFESDIGTVFGPYETTDAFYVFEVEAQHKAYLPTYDDLAAGLSDPTTQHPAAIALIEERQIEAAEKKAEAVEAAIESGQRLEDVAEAEGFVVRTTDLFSRRDYVPGVGRQNEFVGVSFGLRVGETSGVFTAGEPERYYVVRAEERVAPDQQQFAEQREQLRGELLQNERIELFSAWLEGLKERAKIDDFRNMYF